jgi:hypothetical protein
MCHYASVARDTLLLDGEHGTTGNLVGRVEQPAHNRPIDRRISSSSCLSEGRNGDEPSLSVGATRLHSQPTYIAFI